MGDSSLTTCIVVIAIAVVVVALILAAVAWRVRNRSIRISFGVVLVILGLLSTVVSFAGCVLVTGLGVAIFILGLKTVSPDKKGNLSA